MRYIGWVLGVLVAALCIRWIALHSQLIGVIGILLLIIIVPLFVIYLLLKLMFMDPERDFGSYQLTPSGPFDFSAYPKVYQRSFLQGIPAMRYKTAPGPMAPGGCSVKLAVDYIEFSPTQNITERIHLKREDIAAYKVHRFNPGVVKLITQEGQSYLLDSPWFVDRNYWNWFATLAYIR